MSNNSYPDSRNNSTVYYCSGSNVDSTEVGTKENPFKSLDKARRVVTDGSTLLLERGYEYPFFNQFNSRSISFGAYGYGNAPVVSRFAKVRNVDKDLFTRDSATGDIWTINFNKLVELSGCQEKDLLNIGFIYNPYTDSIVYGYKVAFPDPVSREMAFDYKRPSQGQLQAYTSLPGNLVDKGDGKFYQSADGHVIKVYNTTDPNESVYPKDFNVPQSGEDDRMIQELWFATGGSFIVHPHDCEIRDIKIVGFGRHAIEGGMSNVRIENVQIDLIGGMTQDPSTVGTVNFVRLGNGVEVWCSIQKPTKNVSVSHCVISRIFDCATTLQGSLDYVVPFGAENVVFSHNLIRNCRSSFEGFLYIKGVDEKKPGIGSVKNCKFCNNKAYFAGYSGFCNDGKADGHLISGMPGMEISDNYFYGGNFMSRFDFKFGLEMGAGNICHIQPGQSMIHIFAKKDNPDAPDHSDYPENPTNESVAAAVAQYRTLAHDNHTVFVGIDSIVSMPKEN